LEGVVAKATDEKLTSENWEYILDVCDKINEDAENGAKNGVAALLKRLTSNAKSANVVMYCLTLAHAMSQNCGIKAQVELASKPFTQALLKIGKDNTVHAKVKSRLLEVMEELTNQYRSDPSLRLMQDAYEKLRRDVPGIKPPEKPDKQKITDADRQKEEEELRIALAMSLSELDAQSQSQTQSNETQNTAAAQAHDEKPEPAMTPATVSRVKALYDFSRSEPGELSFRKGDVITVLDAVYRDWWRGSLRGEVGIFPLNYVTPVTPPTAEELAEEAAQEAKVFAEFKNIEKLLSILTSMDERGASSSIADDVELQNLYQTTQAIRPKLVNLIDKYSQKNDELMKLSEKFQTAKEKYDRLMEES
ncbi:hypothetical protein CANCADRAFT_16116, partial [Tortispora caseinolytica NRRL Y-17796]